MFIQLAITAILNGLGLFGASKLMNISLSLVQAFVVAICVETISQMFLGKQDSFDPIAATAVFAAYIIGLKICTGEGILSAIKLAVFAVILEYAVIATIIKITNPISVGI
ncbi:hypothetical protein JQX08_04975 [Pseudomonas sp. UL073]|uniref:Uncharacterized protein n=1 Tax=Zestomonas insulae TaxID=2809017 RepID=A0ABS2IDQ2_9GAMM|nr:hypothetical protein [Pseudomonas insulae]MBM7060052.1 hypothetical protein [Pseudomonas insulae]